MYALPAREYIEGHAGEVRTNARASIKSLPLQVVVRDELFTADRVICAVPWFALSEVFVDSPPPLRATIDAADRTAASPIVTVNLWFDRVVTDHVLVGLPGRTMQWVFDKRRVFGGQRPPK
jgi:hypothetical protein